jgi:hypothetical protein
MTESSRTLCARSSHERARDVHSAASLFRMCERRANAAQTSALGNVRETRTRDAANTGHDQHAAEQP